jgi:hypothetical protein
LRDTAFANSGIFFNRKEAKNDAKAAKNGILKALFFALFASFFASLRLKEVPIALAIRRAPALIRPLRISARPFLSEFLHGRGRRRAGP